MARGWENVTEAHLKRYIKAEGGEAKPMGLITPTKQTKYHNQPKTVNGYRFDSKREADRYQELLLLEKAGEIRSLQCDKRYLHYKLIVCDRLVSRYTPDFRYFKDGAFVIEDVKSGPTRTQAYIIRKKLMRAIYGIEILETST